MSKPTLEDALIVAVVEAFFRQQQYYDPRGQGTVYYGGELSKVVALACEKMDLKKLAELFVSELENPLNKEAFFAEARKQAPSWFGNSYYSSLQEGPKRVLETALANILTNDEEFKKKVLNSVNLENKNIQITVTISEKR